MYESEKIIAGAIEKLASAVDRRNLIETSKKDVLGGMLRVLRDWYTYKTGRTVR